MEQHALNPDGSWDLTSFNSDYITNIERELPIHRILGDKILSITNNIQYPFSRIMKLAIDSSAAEVVSTSSYHCVMCNPMIFEVTIEYYGGIVFCTNCYKRTGGISINKLHDDNQWVHFAWADRERLLIAEYIRTKDLTTLCKIITKTDWKTYLHKSEYYATPIFSPRQSLQVCNICKGSNCDLCKGICVDCHKLSKLIAQKNVQKFWLLSLIGPIDYMTPKDVTDYLLVAFGSI